MENRMNYVKNLRVAEPICFIFDGEEIRIFDLKEDKELHLSYEATKEFFRDIPFTQSLDVVENGVCPKVDTSIKAVYDDLWGEIELHVLSDDDRYLIKLYIGCYNVLMNLEEFKNATFLNSEMVM